MDHCYSNRDELIIHYFSLGLHHKEMLSFLKNNHGINVSPRNLDKILRRLHLYRKKYYSSDNDIRNFIQEQVNNSSQLHGYRWMHLKCIQNGLIVTQKKVRILLKEIDPVGVDCRRRQRLRRRQYYCKGPNYVWHLDSYDKLKPYGININGCIDGFSRYIIWLKAGRTSSDPKVIAGYFMEAVVKYEGCPCIVRGDLGTENRYVEQMQILLREETMELDLIPKTTFIYGKSTANQRIESWWSILRKHNSQFWMNLFQKMKDDGYLSGSFIDKALIQFCFLDLIQDELNTMVYEWNTHRITSSRNSVSPTGRPIAMYELPQTYNTINYKCAVNPQVVESCLEECVFPNVECDSDVYDLCKLIIEEKNLLLNTKSGYDRASVYVTLRSEIMSLMAT